MYQLCQPDALHTSRCDALKLHVFRRSHADKVELLINSTSRLYKCYTTIDIRLAVNGTQIQFDPYSVVPCVFTLIDKLTDNPIDLVSAVWISR